jgi:hypothetical protein
MFFGEGSYGTGFEVLLKVNGLGFIRKANNRR